MIIIGEEKLLDEMAINYERKTIVISSEAGLGKTELMNDFIKRDDVEIDELVVWRTQSIEDTDLSGIPYINDEKTLEYAKLGVLDKVIKNPHRKYGLFVDEVQRAKKTIEPFLFQLFESKIDGVFYPNLFVFAAINEGDDYMSNIDFSDKALRRRVIKYRYTPDKKTFINGVKKRNYHPLIIEVAEMMDIHYSHEVKDEHEICTTYGSWGDWNHRINKLSKRKSTSLNINEILEDFIVNYSQYFNDIIGMEIINKLNDIIKTIRVDLQKDIIDRGCVPEEYKELEEELLIRVKNFIVKQTILNNDYLTSNVNGIVSLYGSTKELLMTIIYEIINSFKEDEENKKIKLISDFIIAIKNIDPTLVKSISSLLSSRG